MCLCSLRWCAGRPAAAGGVEVVSKNSIGLYSQWCSAFEYADRCSHGSSGSAKRRRRRCTARACRHRPASRDCTGTQSEDVGFAMREPPGTAMCWLAQPSWRQLALILSMCLCHRGPWVRGGPLWSPPRQCAGHCLLRTDLETQRRVRAVGVVFFGCWMPRAPVPTRCVAWVHSQLCSWLQAPPHASCAGLHGQLI